MPMPNLHLGQQNPVWKVRRMKDEFCLLPLPLAYGSSPTLPCMSLVQHKNQGSELWGEGKGDKVHSWQQAYLSYSENLGLPNPVGEVVCQGGSPPAEGAVGKMGMPRT